MAAKYEKWDEHRYATERKREANEIRFENNFDDSENVIPNEGEQTSLKTVQEHIHEKEQKNEPKCDGMEEDSQVENMIWIEDLNTPIDYEGTNTNENIGTYKKTRPKSYNDGRPIVGRDKENKQCIEQEMNPWISKNISSNTNLIRYQVPSEEAPPPYEECESSYSVLEKRRSDFEDILTTKDSNPVLNLLKSYELSKQSLELSKQLPLNLIPLNTISERLGSIEKSVEETNIVMQRQETLSERLERIERMLQEKTLSEDSVSQRIVEMVTMSIKQFGRTAEEESIGFRHVQEHDKTVPLWTVPSSKKRPCNVCFCANCSCSCHFSNRHGDWIHPSDDARSTKGSRGNNKRQGNVHKKEVENVQYVAGACGGDPEESPSDNSSSDDDDESGYDHKNGNYRKKMKNESRQSQQWEIDTEAWNMCLSKGADIEEQKALLNKLKIPDGNILKALCSKCGLSSWILKEICKNICIYIKMKSEIIVHVSATTKGTYRSGDDIVFVVMTNKAGTFIEKDFEIFQRSILEVDESDLAKEINRKEYDNPLSHEEMDNAEKCLKDNAKSLMKKHTNLTRVTSSWFREEKDTNAETPSLRRELCIALYVSFKGYIPVGEKYFPKNIGGFPVVVREGIFTLCKGANEYHQNVKMGCAIGGERIGTLGAFIELENDTSLYGLTCAHVVLENLKLKTLIEKGTVFFNNSCQTVFQPATEDFKPLGTAVVVHYQRGGNGLVGMEIAVIKINQDREPVDGTFPDDADHASLGFDQDRPFVFCSGNVFNTTASRLRSCDVYKYGCESKLTQGICRVNGASVRTMEFKDDILGSELVLHGQIEIHSLESFAKYGDSGALVFINEGKEGLSALGMLVGKMKGTRVYSITPIYDVLNKISQLANRKCRLKPFQQLYSETHCDPPVNVELFKTVTLLKEDFEKHKKEITSELRKQNDENVKRNQEIMTLVNLQALQKEELTKQNEELRRLGELHIKQSQELRDQQEKKSEEIKDQYSHILKLLMKNEPECDKK